ncbi:DUF5076 domain-containing protein [Hansschlegelia sp. KR7-227]|uniref:DUF5076 domain-containing protein n=1 Tax=Hansschlegelia sp. KR7-227 TaxID=3400914 RepID=UPI003C0DA589
MAETSKLTIQELAVPLFAYESAEATEVLRAWIVDDGLRVSLQRGFDDPAASGALLTDVERHVARIFETKGFGTQGGALTKNKAMLDAESDGGTDMGSTSAIQ